MTSALESLFTPFHQPLNHSTQSASSHINIGTNDNDSQDPNKSAKETVRQRCNIIETIHWDGSYEHNARGDS